MIELYAINILDKIEAGKYEKLFDFVSEEKRAKLSRFLNPEDAKRSLYGEILARIILAEKLKISNKELNFDKNEFGKPFVKNDRAVFFNISHSGRWVVCGIGDAELGVDIEEIRPIDFDIARHYFSEEEYADVRKCRTSEEKTKYFYELWTLKESYIKAIGLGLSQPLDAFTVKINNSAISLKIGNNLSERYFFKKYHMDWDYSMAVCSAKSNLPEKIIMITAKELYGKIIVSIK